jgi:hypothetical protein
MIASVVQSRFLFKIFNRVPLVDANSLLEGHTAVNIGSARTAHVSQCACAVVQSVTRETDAQIGKTGAVWKKRPARMG